MNLTLGSAARNLADKLDGTDDIVAYMAARGGRIHELDVELQSLRKQHQEQAQQLELREAEVASLKSQLTTWRAVKDAEAASLSSSNKQLAEQLAREIAHSKTQDKQLSTAHTEWASTKQQVEQLQQQLGDAKQQAAAAASLSDLTIKDLNVQLSTARREAAERGRSSQQALALEQTRLRAEQDAHALTQQQLTDARQQLAAALARAADAGAAAAAAQGRAIKAEAQAASMAGSDAQVLLKSLQEQVKQQAAQVAAAQEAVQQAVALPGLRQQLQRVQEELREAKAGLEQAQAAQAQLTQLQNELELWRTAFKSALGIDHPSPQALAALQSKQQHLDKQRHAMQVELATTKAEAADLRQQLAAAEAKQAAASADLHKAQQQLAQAQLQLKLGQTELEGLKRLVALLEREQEGDAAAAAGAGTADGAEARSGAAKLEALQAFVADLQAAQVQLQAQLKQANDAEAAAKAGEAAAQAELKRQEKELDEVAATADALQAQLAGGEYDPTCTRIMHLVANPAAELSRLQDKAELEKLREENASLKQALTARGGTAASGAAGPSAAAAGSTTAPAAGGNSSSTADAEDPVVAAAVAAAEAKLLRRQLAAAEKQAAAMKDVFKQRVKAFRESCRALFGYRMEMVSDPWADVQHAPTTYTLTSCFGPKEDLLMFRSATMETFCPRYHPQAEPPYSILKTPLSKKLAQDVQVFIHNFRSIPAFTANHTMTLFQQTTSGA
ncbi:mitotic checkpoint protein-domain-containing protein [Scenedesmus sp. NREL 46B-D3]|nr:mitotic checkpoint protein-domain-containing protein [Scenedesmus sp. NREL 46B-D3]